MLRPPAAAPNSTPGALSLRTNFSWTFAGNVIYAGCQWGMLVVLAKAGSPEAVGKFTLGLALTAPVILFSNLQLRKVQATDARYTYRFGDYLGLRLVMSLVALVVIAGIAVSFTDSLETAAVVMAVGLAKTIESVSDVFYGLFQQDERMDRIAISLMVKGPLSLLALGGVVFLTHSIVLGSLALACAWLVVMFAYDLRSGRLILSLRSEAVRQGRLPMQTLEDRVKPQWHWVTVKRLVWLALPMGLVMMMNSLLPNMPRYFLEHHQGERALGFYGAMAYIMTAGGTVVGALGQSASPRLARFYAGGDLRRFKKLVFYLLGIGALLGVGGVFVAVVAGKSLLRIMYTQEYAEHADVLTWIMVASGLSYMSGFLGEAMTAARYFKIQVPFNVVFILMTLGASAALIPAFGLMGAAWVSCVVAALQLPLKGAVVLHSLRAIEAKE